MSLREHRKNALKEATYFDLQAFKTTAVQLSMNDSKDYKTT